MWPMGMDARTVWLSFNGVPNRGRWDQTWVADLLPVGETMVDGWDAPSGNAVVVVAGDVDPDRLDAVLNKLDAVILVVTSNEESVFDYHRFAGENRVLWLHTPTTGDLPAGYKNVRYLPTGWTPGTVERFAASCPTKDLVWSFAGQDTHPRRNKVIALGKSWGYQEMQVHASEGFGQGLPPDQYADLLRRTRWVPCPAGAVSLDSFRVYEALQADAIPILDTITATGYRDPEFWDLLFGADHPFDVIPTPPHSGWEESDWDEQIPGDSRDSGDWGIWEERALHVFPWWTRFKRAWREALQDDLDALNVQHVRDNVTVVITASPIPSHPEITMIENTIQSIRRSGLQSEIIVAFDGIRPEQAARTADYQEHIRRVCWAAANKWQRVSVHVEPAHVHQANMFRNVLPTVGTGTVLFVEHDTPIVGEVDWAGCLQAVTAGGVDMLRFHYDDIIHHDHQWLLVDQHPVDMGVPVLRTRQWSQRPHLASTDWYRRILDDHFPVSSSTMIEDRMHSIAQQGEWEDCRLAIYTPEGGYRRSGHFDGRGADIKYDMEFG